MAKQERVFSHFKILIYHGFSSNLAPKRGANNIQLFNSNFAYKFGYKFCKVICRIINHWLITISKANKVWSNNSEFFSKKRYLHLPIFPQKPPTHEAKEVYLLKSLPPNSVSYCYQLQPFLQSYSASLKMSKI